TVSESEAYRKYFFFSSRRRHTRSKRDWSSDVCSSDLPPAGYRNGIRKRSTGSDLPGGFLRSVPERPGRRFPPEDASLRPAERRRSEERRVGKEGRCRGGGAQ